MKAYVKLCPAAHDFLSFLPSWALKKTGVLRVRKIYADSVDSSRISRMKSQKLKWYLKHTTEATFISVYTM